MATFTITPDFGASYEVKPNVRQTKFGDGYEQRQANAPFNTRAKKWALRFSLRTDAEVAAIIAFLEAQNGVASFDWTAIDGTTGKYVCRSWSSAKERFNLNTVSCEFEQVFEP